MTHRKASSPWVLGVTFLTIYLANFFLAWPTTRWSSLSQPNLLFGDFSWLSTWSTKCRLNVGFPEIFSVYSQLEASETCPGFNYGMSLLILLSIFPVAWEFYIAAALVVGILGVFALGFFLAISYRVSHWQKVLVCIAFFSPATYLLFERGNFDLVIFLLVVIAGVLFGRSQYLPTFLVLVFATLLKFYAMPIVILVSLLARKLRQQLLVSILTLLTLTWIVFDFSRGGTLIGYGPAQFGYPVLNHYFEWLGLSLGPIPNLLGFLAPWLVWALLVILERRAGTSYRNKLRQSIDNLQADYVFIFTAIVFCGVFFVGLSFDYRLIFLALAGVGLLLKTSLSQKLKVTLWVSLFSALWGSANFGDNLMFIPPDVRPFLVYGAQLLGDLAVFLWVGILLYVVSLVIATKMECFGKLLAFVTRSKIIG